MNVEKLQVRRATVEDLPRLIPLWQDEGLPVADLEKRFKEFQLVEIAGGGVVGAVGLQIAGSEGRLHSEAFAHPEFGDAAREKLWERAQTIAKNHGLVRLWTQFHAPFWHANGLKSASDDETAHLPPAFVGDPAPWLFLQLKEDAAPAVSVDKEFALFKEAEQERTQKIFRQAKLMKTLAVVIVVGVFLLALVWAFLFFRVQSKGAGR